MCGFSQDDDDLIICTAAFTPLTVVENSLELNDDKTCFKNISVNLLLKTGTC